MSPPPRGTKLTFITPKIDDKINSLMKKGSEFVSGVMNFMNSEPVKQKYADFEWLKN